MTANEGQRRPTKSKKGPNDTSGVVWALGVFFFSNFFSILLTTKAHSSQRRPPKANAGPQQPTQVHEGPQQPMTANEGQHRPTKTKRAQTTPSGVVWALGVFFFHFFDFILITMRQRPPHPYPVPLETRTLEHGTGFLRYGYG